MKLILSKIFAKAIIRRNKKWVTNPIQTQEKVFQQLIREGSKTLFGRDHNFSKISTIADFQKAVPIRSYEELKTYMDRVVEGEADILWPGKPLYLSKTSGTTSGAKYIPLTKASMPTHIKSARDAILNYINYSGKSEFVSGKMIFLQGSPVLDHSKKIPTGRLSGIVAHYVPRYLQKNRLPSLETNSIEDWEEKLDAIIEETKDEKMTLISGIPPWVQMYFEKLIRKTGKQRIKDIFPNFSLFIYGGVNYQPYQRTMENLVGKKVDSVELYPASEGFIAYQDRYDKEGMLLLVDNGIFYEFILADEFYYENPKRYTLSEVEIGTNYVIILSTTAGLWAYNIGDTVKFTSINPYRVKVSGRIKHFTSAFGEHVIAEEVDQAMAYTSNKLQIEVKEFHLAPQVNPAEKELPYHEWLIEFIDPDLDYSAFQSTLNQKMIELNPYYKDLIEGNILQVLKISALRKGTFQKYMKQIGKLGGQNKLPRLANDRKIADSLLKLNVS